MLLRHFALLGRKQLNICIFQHARYFSQELVANRPEDIKKFLEREKIEKPTLIQEKTLPIAMDSKNLVGIARTGSSKTLAFDMPAVMKVLRSVTTYRYNVSGGAQFQQVRNFHAKASKVRYLDFRYRFNTCHLRSHLLIIRRQKMKKHRRTKWRKKFKSVIAKMRLKREIAKEKTFRVELLTMIKRAEQFDPREYALKKIHEINNRPREPTREERLDELKELIRKHRYQVDYIKPKHKRAEI